MDTETEERKPRVFVIEQLPFDYRAADAFGEVYFFQTTARLAPDAPTEQWNATIIHGLRRELAGYIAGIDWIVPTGAPERMVLVGMLLAERGERHNLLKWDARTQRYVPYSFNLRKENGSPS